VSGNLAGGALQLVQSATVNYLQALGAEKIKAISAELGGEGSPGHVALHAVLGCAGGAAQGGSCGAGAAGASASVVLNALFDRLGDAGAELSAKEREDRTNLITTIVAGVASAVDSGSAVTAATAARIEAENNAMAGLMNRREVAPVAAMLIEEVELGCLSAGDMNRCLTEGWQQVDQVVSAYDRAVTMQHYPAMTTQRAREVAQTAVDLAPFVSNASSLYELMNGSSPVSGEEANRWLAALGVVPVFGGMIRGAGKSLLEIARAATAEGAVKGVGGGVKATGGAAGKVDDLVTSSLNSASNLPSGTVLGGFKVGLSADDITSINSQFGGSVSFREVDTAIANAANYDGFYNKAGSMIRDIAGGHLFDNGNKRTAVEVVERLIIINGVDGPSKQIIWNVVDKVATGKLNNVQDISKALRGLD